MNRRVFLPTLEAFLGKNHGFYGVFHLLRSKLVDNKIPKARITTQRQQGNELLYIFFIGYLFMFFILLKNSKTKKMRKKPAKT